MPARARVASTALPTMMGLRIYVLRWETLSRARNSSGRIPTSGWNALGPSGLDVSIFALGEVHGEQSHPRMSILIALHFCLYCVSLI